MFGDIYRNQKILLTGHTGFKGSWLALWLQSLGAEVIGLSLKPDTKPNHWDLLKLGIRQHHADIRDAEKIARIIKKEKPDLVFHLAAQSLVRRSYRQPQETWATNVLGTVNVLEACRQTPSVKAIVVVTTDKCYENKESISGYTEGDRLGGHDPYSASKAATELAVSSYRDAFFSKSAFPLVASARAGNVIGGGDWSEDRLVPDAMRACAAGEVLSIRSPNAIRPWQHVLEPLSGYLLLGQKLLQGMQDYAEPWNFGPDTKDALSVSQILNQLSTHMPDMKWQVVPDATLHETAILNLDSTKAHEKLGWRPVWLMDEQIKKTAQWYQSYHADKSVISPAQLKEYCEDARKQGVLWA